ncbi:MAG: ribosome small subunit-dependent GTPase A [Bryobacteraceae bacterium]|nr:ribosome small subunit-dependent GTPase A [Bryobacterales bacterium]MEB2362760.1 ribosome small subunit-dependent GTPase A [Bryobacterales bacterium]NUN00094.1 ribosome small subunit-dependent GTPase A [Bryobacteraceae bacterium]
MFLEHLGADQTVYGAFSPYARQQMVLARVAVAQRDVYHLYMENGSAQAEPSGRLYYHPPGHSHFPVTGDWVAARIVGPEQALVEAVLPRRTCLSRRAPGRREEEQPLAANVDLVFLVCGLDGDFNLRRLERYLALVTTSGASPVVVLNKADLCADLAGRMAETAAVARRVPVVAASTRDGQGLDALRRFLTPGATAALLGSSGVGKSSIANRLLGEERFRTGEVRMRDSRGRHITVRRELTPLPQTGALIDTPGMRELQPWTGPESIDAVFDDITAIAQDCRFRDCSHSGEPGCAVAAALDLGQVDTDRWANFQKLRAEAEWHEAISDPLTALERKRKWKIIHKQVRAFNKSRR